MWMFSLEDTLGIVYLCVTGALAALMLVALIVFAAKKKTRTGATIAFRIADILLLIAGLAACFACVLANTELFGLSVANVGWDLSLLSGTDVLFKIPGVGGIADIWETYIGMGLVGLITLLALIDLILAGTRRRKNGSRSDKKAEEARIAAEEAKAREDEAAELERIRQEREAQVRASGQSVEDLLTQRVEEEKVVEEAEIEEAERKLQQVFATEYAESGEQPTEDNSETLNNNEDTAGGAEEKVEEEERLFEEAPAAAEAKEEEAKVEEPVKAEEPKKATEPKKPAAKKAAEAKKETKPTETVMYSIVYDRAAREWVVRKTGSPRAIRRLRTKAEALEYAEQLSVRQGLALQVHKKDGKFQKKN